MKKNILLILATVLVSSSFAQKMYYKYPQAKQGSVSEDYHGTMVSDPYRWLEDENSEATKTWMKQEMVVTNAYMKDIDFRDNIKNQLTELWDYATVGTPTKYGEYFIYTKNDGKQNQSVYYINSGETGEEEILLDPNKLSEDGTTSVSGISVSNDNKYMAYLISRSGSDWKEVAIIDLATKETLTEKVNWLKFSGVAWYKDGFYYSGYGIPKEGKEFSQKNKFHTVFYHKIGTEQKQDKVIYKDAANPLKNHYAKVTDDERFLVISGSKGTSGNNLIAKDLMNIKNDFVTIIEGFATDNWVIDNFDDQLLIETNYGASNKQLILTPLNGQDPDSWQILVPEKNYVLEGASIAGDKLFLTYLKDVQTKIEVYEFNGKYLKDLVLPGIGISSGISGKKGDPTAYYNFTSFITPSSSYRLDVPTLNSQLYFQPTTSFNSDDYVTTQVFYKSKDGADIPMFVSYKKGIQFDGQNPTLLYGYGGFNISYKPKFDAAKAVFMMNGGMYAVANLRGGGEYGEEWHRAGMLANKHKVFEDFIAAAEYLKKQQYTSTEKLAIHGRSNGGLLIGAVMTQRPDLAKVALPMVGVLDMLRYHKFTIGWAWAVEYGSSDNKEQFEYLYEYSPLHNVKPGEYPATMILTADHDDRVVPAHSFKFAAELQKQQQGDNACLIRIDTKSGHGSGKSKTKLIEEWSDIWAFTFYNMGIVIK